MHFKISLRMQGSDKLVVRSGGVEAALAQWLAYLIIDPAAPGSNPGFGVFTDNLSVNEQHPA